MVARVMSIIIFPELVNFTHQKHHPIVDYVQGDRLILGVDS